jgi:hypothetical protein
MQGSPVPHTIGSHRYQRRLADVGRVFTSDRIPRSWSWDQDLGPSTPARDTPPARDRDLGSRISDLGSRSREVRVLSDDMNVAADDDDDDATDSSSSSPPLMTNLDVIRNAAFKALDDDDDVEAERLFELILYLLSVERAKPPSVRISKAYEGIAACKRVRGHGDDAVDALEKCVFWDDAYAGGWLSLAEECVENDQIARAAEAFRAFRERCDGVNALESVRAQSVQTKLRIRLEDLPEDRNDASSSAGSVQTEASEGND